jgi:hypothetical protein
VRHGASTTCTVTAENQTFSTATVQLQTTTSDNLRITGSTGATVNGRRVNAGPATLAGKLDATPAIAPGASPAGYLPLSLFGIGATPVGDESIVNFTVPDYVFAGRTFNRLGITSDGYIVAGGGTAADVSYLAQTLPDAARPNGVIAPYWTDLDGTNANGVSVAVLTDGVNSWLVVQWELKYFGGAGAAGERDFQAWIGINGTEDISYTYDPSALQGVPGGVGPLTVGAENLSATGGAQITGAPTTDYVVTSTPGAPGGSLSYTVTVRGGDRGLGAVTSTMTASLVPGQTIVSTPVNVTR